MLTITKNMLSPTALVGSYPRPLWCTESLRGRPFKAALGDSLFREQYVDSVTCIINAQESASLDIVTDGDARFDLAVGGKSWFFYVGAMRRVRAGKAPHLEILLHHQAFGKPKAPRP
jgi:5-methyltetrahydropteroyltriglutamate--homocysteine methyltransferase